MNIILTGGFTGGHIVPLIRLREKYKEKYNFYYVGYKGYLEERLTEEAEIDFIGLYKEQNIFKTILRKKHYFKQIDTFLSGKKIDLVISSGGAHSLPSILYARKKKIKYILIEENAKFGILNILFKNKAKKVITNFSFKNKEYVVAPNPSIYFNPLKALNEKKYDFLFIGGSLGSKVLNEFAIKVSKAGYKVLLICGRYKDYYKKYESNNLKVLGYVDTKMYFNLAKIVITRAGSATIFELVRANTAFIMIPALKTKRNHQYHNALCFEKLGLGLLMNEKKLNVNELVSFLNYDFTSILNEQKNYINSFKDNVYEEIIEEYNS